MLVVRGILADHLSGSTGYIILIESLIAAMVGVYPNTKNSRTGFEAGTAEHDVFVILGQPSVA